MTKELFVASLGFGLFVVCPRMAGMMHVINTNSGASILKTVLFGVFISIPILLLMVFTFGKFGVWGALTFCVFTDVAAAFVVKEISFKASIETIIIALFVIIGVKIAPVISKLIIHN